MKSRIMIIEDDPAISAGLEESFREQNYEVICEQNGEKGFIRIKDERPDIIILDINLPDKNGMDICRDLRMEGNYTPILMLTSRIDEADKVLGLELGADDYVTKPFSLRELQARIKAMLRRKSDIGKEIDRFCFGNIIIDFKRMEAFKASEQIKFSLKEFEILKFFIEHEGEVISRNKLLDEVWGYGTYPTTRTVDNYILVIRKKIEANPAVPEHLLTFHTAGYKFVK